jgi:hypothetical protein
LDARFRGTGSGGGCGFDRLERRRFRQSGRRAPGEEVGVLLDDERKEGAAEAIQIEDEIAEAIAIGRVGGVNRESREGGAEAADEDANLRENSIIDVGDGNFSGVEQVVYCIHGGILS